MAGSTGKMKAEAIRRRGPRKVLFVLRGGHKVIFLPGHTPISNENVDRLVNGGLTLARSYDTRYLLRIGRGG